MDVKEAIRCAVEGRDLTRRQARAVVDAVMSGAATEAQIGAWLVALRMKGETVAELAGAAEAMRRHATPVHYAGRPLVDTCGTGGDGAATFNISTAAAFVVAGAGVPVAKHGNRSVSSRSGSADVLEALGVDVAMPPERAAEALDGVGLAFLFAPLYHGAMKHAAGPRRELGLRTLFNLLGPLTNPAGADVQVLGVFDARWVEPVARVLATLGTRRAFVVHGAGGLDELSLSGPSRVAEVREERVEVSTFDPGEVLGWPRRPPEALRGGDATDNGRAILEVLAGRKGPHREAVVLNAAAALLAARDLDDWPEAVALAEEAIDAGRAMAVLDGLRRHYPRHPT